jgi:hypothetical protein
MSPSTTLEYSKRSRTRILQVRAENSPTYLVRTVKPVLTMFKINVHVHDKSIGKSADETSRFISSLSLNANHA